MPPPRTTAEEFLAAPEQRPLAPPPPPQAPAPAPQAQPGFFQAAMQPFGLAPTPETTRQAVQSLPGPLRAGVEAAPSIAGTLGGAVLGGPFGAMAGAGGMEALAQLQGLAPQSKANLALSPLSAGAGYGLGRGVPLAAKLAVTKFPGVRQAVRQLEVEKLFPMAKQYLSKYAPPTAVRELYRQATEQGFRVPGAAFAQTRTATATALKKLRRRFFTKTFKEGRELRHVLGQFRDYLETPNVQLDVLVEARQLIGRMFQDFARTRGIKLGMAGQVERALVQDMDQLAKAVGARGSQATAAVLRAIEAAKRQFALFKLERAWAQGFRAPDRVSVRPILDKLADWTNPKSKLYDKNFVSTLGDQVPELTAMLQRVERVLMTGKRQTGGLMVAGRLATAGERAFGGLIGGVTGGAVGGGPMAGVFGAILGLNAPEMFASLALSPGGRWLLEHALRLGSGQLTPRLMAMLATAATRQASSGVEQVAERVTLPSLRGAPPQGGQRPPRRPAEEFLR